MPIGDVVIVEEEDNWVFALTQAAVLGRCYSLVSKSKVPQRQPGRETLYYLARIICRTIINNENFVVVRGKALADETFKGGGQQRRAIRCWDDDTDGRWLGRN